MSSRRPYATDLSNEEWWILESPLSLKLNREAGPAPTRLASSRAPSSTQCAAAALGASFLTTSSRPGRPHLPLLPYLATRWHRGADQQRLGRARPRDGRSRSDAQRGDDHGQSERREPRRKAALAATRRCQEDKRPQTPPFSGHERTGDEGKSASG